MMKITKQNLRKIIRESILSESVKMQARDMLDQDYHLVSDDTQYPYGRYRGDVKRVMVYSRKDGQPVPGEDLELLKARDIQVRKDGGSMPALAGLYSTRVSNDGMTIIVTYTRHTAG